MIDFSSVGAWFDQAGKDIDQGGQDFGETVLDGAQVIGEALPGVAQVVGDVAQVVGETVQDGAQVVGDVVQVIGDVFNPANGPSGDAIVDQIESQIPNNSGPNGDRIVDQIESQIGQQSTSVVPDPLYGSNTNDYVVGTDFNNPAPELPSPVFETFDPLTNPNSGLEVRAFEYGAVGVDALSIDITNEEESYSRAIELFEEWLELGGGGGYGYMEDLRQQKQSIEYLLNERLQEAIDDVQMF